LKTAFLGPSPKNYVKEKLLRRLMIPEEEMKEETFKLDPGKTSDRQIDDD
jgi:hypothetical protein